jgi:hypothetical protein
MSVEYKYAGDSLLPHTEITTDEYNGQRRIITRHFTWLR